MRLKIYYKNKMGERYPGIIVEPNGIQHIPDRTVPKGENMVNWKFMEKYIGEDVEFYINGILKEITILERVGQDENGIWFFELPYNTSRNISTFY